MCPYDYAIIRIPFRSHSRISSDLFVFAPIDCNRAESKHDIRVSDVIDSAVFFFMYMCGVRRLHYVYSKLV